MVVKKTFVAPDDELKAGDLVYEVEDAELRRIQVRSPIDGVIRQNTVPTGTVIEAPSIILTIEAASEEAVFEVKEDPKPAEETSPETGAQPSKKEAESGEKFPFLYGPTILIAMAICLFCLWVSLHLTHSLAPALYRYGGLAIALVLPFILFLLLPGKSRPRSLAEAYLGGFILGTLLNICLFIASMFVPIQWIAAIDSPYVHRQLSPITFSPMLEIEDTIYLLGEPIAKTQAAQTIPLSNGGVLEVSSANFVATRRHGQIWNADGERGTRFQAHKIKVGEYEDGETRIIVYDLPDTVTFLDTTDLDWTYRTLDNAGRLMSYTQPFEEGENAFTPPLPGEFYGEVRSFEARLSDGERVPELAARNDALD